jgi:hypothetical protein
MAAGMSGDVWDIVVEHDVQVFNKELESSAWIVARSTAFADLMFCFPLVCAL